MGADAQAGLQRIITVHAENARLSSVLGLVAREAGLRLSYNAAAVPGDSIVSLHAQQWTTERALKSVLPASVRWKESGAHLIIINNTPTYLNVRADVAILEDVATIIPAIMERVLNG